MSGKDLLVPASEAVGPRRRWRWLGLVALLILAVIAVVTVWRPPASGVGLAGEAVVTASSTRPGVSSSTSRLRARRPAPGAVWQSNDETIGAWIELSWPKAHDLRQLTIVRNSLDEPGMTSGVLSFEDGSFLQFDLALTSPTTQISFTPRMASRVRMTVTGVQEPDTRHVTVAEILIGHAPLRRRTSCIDQAPGWQCCVSAVATQNAELPGVGSSRAAGRDRRTGRGRNRCSLDSGSPAEQLGPARMGRTAGADERCGRGQC